jgi:hypothetical protein
MSQVRARSCTFKRNTRSYVSSSRGVVCVCLCGSIDKETYRYSTDVTWTWNWIPKPFHFLAIAHANRGTLFYFGFLTTHEPDLASIWQVHMNSDGTTNTVQLASLQVDYRRILGSMRPRRCLQAVLDSLTIGISGGFLLFYIYHTADAD